MSSSYNSVVDIVLNKFTSTVYQCDTTQDARYIRCDFKRCSKHTLNTGGKIPVDYWIRNTEKNVKILEKHVSDEVYNFVASLEADEDELNAAVNCSLSKDQFELNTHLLDSKNHILTCTKLLVVFNLRDPQSNIGRWIDSFISATKNEEKLDINYLCITLSFSSRKELMQQVCKLRALTPKSNKLEVIIVLSCHSSSQGQVFSCTPTFISKLYQFEEFCSIHDFVCTCQYVLKHKLRWIHISSCFSMKMNVSHKDWPVEYTWYKKKLRCLLSGSAKEVYETGSQTADLFLLLNVILERKCVETQFLSIFQNASLHLFPDLILEMGLTSIDTNTITTMMENPERDDSVTKPQVVDSSIHLVIIYSEDDYTYPLKEAIIQNLMNRNTTDVKSNISLINIKLSDNCMEQLLNAFNDLLSVKKKIFFIVLGYFVDTIPFMQALSLCHWKSIFEVYGVYMNRLTESDHLYLKINISSLNLTVTGFLENDENSSKYTNPILLYIVHLSLGENGNVRSSDTSSTWLLQDVYNEVLNVLPGLCEKSNLILVSKVAIDQSTNNSSTFKVGAVQIDTQSTFSSIGQTGTKLNEEINLRNSQSDTSVVDTNLVPLDGQVSTEREVADNEVLQIDPISPLQNTGLETSAMNNSSISSLKEDSDSLFCNSAKDKDNHLEASLLTKQLSEECTKSKIYHDVDSARQFDDYIPNQQTKETKYGDQEIKKLSHHRLDPKYPCSMCHRTFITLEKLKHHENNHKSYRYKCEICGKLFCKKKSISNHMLKDHDITKAVHDIKMEPQERITKSKKHQKSIKSKFMTHLEIKKEPLEEEQNVDGKTECSVDKVNNQPVLRIKRECQDDCQIIKIIDPFEDYEQPSNRKRQQSSDEDYDPSDDIDIDDFDSNVKKNTLNKNNKSILHSTQTLGSKQKLNVKQRKIQCGDKGDSCESSRESDNVPINSENRRNLEEDFDDNKVDFNIHIYEPLNKMSVKYSQRIRNKEDKKVVHQCTIKYHPTNRKRKPEKTEKATCLNKDVPIIKTDNLIIDASVHQAYGKQKDVHHVENIDQKNSHPQNHSSESDLQRVSGDLIKTEKISDDQSNSTSSIPEPSEKVCKLSISDEKNKEKLLYQDHSRKYIHTGKSNFKCKVNSDIDVKNEPKKVSGDDKFKKESISKISEPNYDLLDDLTKELKDVPLMANVDEVLVHHYKLELDVDFEEKCINGNILLFIKPTNDEVSAKEFQMCLDCTLIDIESVNEISLPDDFNIHFHNKSSSRHKDTKPLHCDSLKGDPCISCSFLQNYKKHMRDGLKYKTLSYAVYGWCIRIWKESVKWPKCVYIKYRTKPIGPSLMWCTDSDGNPCVFTPGAYINNRSMMPCQEPPVAMATWQASIQVPDGFIVLSSGDEVNKKLMEIENVSNKFFFEMSLSLPSSTLAFAFGKFVRSSRTVPVLCSPNTSVVNVSLYASASMIEIFEKEYLDLAVKYLKAACQVLGKYPFTRVDLVLMPRSFACLGLESPNLTFLSQSVLCGDQSMSTRIAHEISHAWFGLLVGAEDWIEEWLSEGFATYIEDRILAHGLEMTEKQFSEYSYLMQILRYRTLKAEISVTEDDNLKRLRPIRNQSKSVVEAVNDSILENDSAPPQAHIMIPNAAVSSKKWSQVHYLKGYFLLQRMAKKVGLDNFDAFLRYYLEVYAGQLVTSEMFFNLYVEYYSLPLTFKDEIINQWMENTTVPIFEEENPITNSLVLLVEVETKFWKFSNSSNKRCKKSGYKRKLDVFKTRPNLDANQLVLLLENLIPLNEMVHQTLTQMNQVYKFATKNSEVRHRWCELVIKHLYNHRYEDVKRFLIEDQGMGIYLYAELIITGNQKQKDIAVNAFDIIKDEMDRSTFTTVREILYGSDESNQIH